VKQPETNLAPSHTVETKKVILRAAPKSIARPESTGTFIRPTQRSPPRRAQHWNPAQGGAGGTTTCSRERREEARELRAHPASPQPCPAAPRSRSASPQQVRTGASAQRRGCKMGQRAKCEGYGYA